MSNLLRFKFWLSESTINAKVGSVSGERHKKNYIEPYLPGKNKHDNDTHTLASDYEGLKKGTKLTLHGIVKKSGKYHVIAKHKDSNKTVTIPTSKINKPSTGKEGKHNEEHAVKKVWNYFSSKNKGKDLDLNKMHSEIEKSKTDKNHPLHISKAENHEFAGKIKHNANAKKTYYENLSDAVHTVHALSNHKDFKHHWKNSDTMEHAGKERPELSDLYKKHGVKGAGATSKGDALILRSKHHGYKGVKSLSFKKEGGAQLMSSSPAEFHSIYHHALNNYFKR